MTTTERHSRVPSVQLGVWFLLVMLFCIVADFAVFVFVGGLRSMGVLFIAFWVEGIVLFIVAAYNVLRMLLRKRIVSLICFLGFLLFDVIVGWGIFVFVSTVAFIWLMAHGHWS